MDELRIFTIIKKLLICFNVYRLPHTNNLNPFFEEITVSLNKTIIRCQLEDFNIGILSVILSDLKIIIHSETGLMKGGLIKNDKLTIDLTTELTGLWDQHKLIAPMGAFTLSKCHTWYGKLHRTTKNIRSFLVSSTNQIFLFELKEEW